MSTKQDNCNWCRLQASSRHYHFHPSLILPVKMVTTVTCKYYWKLVVNPTVTNCCKELHLECDRVPIFAFENVAIHKNYSGFVWKPVFFLIILKCCYLYRNSLCFSLLLFTAWWSIFHQPFSRLLPLSCFFRSSQLLFKVKITCKGVNFIKK